MITERLFSKQVRKRNFSFPPGYKRIFELGLTNLEPWYFLANEEFKTIDKGLNSRYTSRLVVPFARRMDCDDVACFVVDSQLHAQNSVIVIHDYASPGYEIDKICDDFWAWFRLAVEEMIEWSMNMTDT